MSEFTAEEVLKAFDVFWKAAEDDGEEVDFDDTYYYPGEHVDWDEFAYHLQSKWDYTVNPRVEKPEGEEIPGLGWVTVEAEFGGEGQGDSRWIVFKVGDQFFRKDGWYTSYEGTNWGDGDFAEVHPKEKVVTVYEK